MLIFILSILSLLFGTGYALSLFFIWVATNDMELD